MKDGMTAIPAEACRLEKPSIKPTGSQSVRHTFFMRLSWAHKAFGLFLPDEVSRGTVTDITPEVTGEVERVIRVVVG